MRVIPQTTKRAEGELAMARSEALFYAAMLLTVLVVLIMVPDPGGPGIWNGLMSFLYTPFAVAWITTFLVRAVNRGKQAQDEIALVDLVCCIRGGVRWAGVGDWQSYPAGGRQ